MKPQYDFGDQVRVTRAIRNDGTMPGYGRGDLLVRRGSVGYVREWGIFLMDQVIYQIHFLEHDLIVGCREQELIPADLSWHAGQFQYGDRVACVHALAANGAVAVTAGECGRIEATGQGATGESYTVMFNDRWFQVPPGAIRLMDDEV